MKKCIECLVEKPLKEYYNHRTNLDGKYSKCKECFKAYSRERFKINMQNPKYKEKRRLKAEKDRYTEAMKEIRRIRKNTKARERYKQKKENGTINTT